MSRFAVATLLFLILSLPCAAQRAPLIVILLPGTSLADWRSADAPNLHRLMASGALAVMNTRTARLPNDKQRESPESACLTLAAGSRAAGASKDVQLLPSDTASALYLRRMGKPASPGRMLDVTWPQIIAKNSGRDYAIQPGNLGEALEIAGAPLMAGGGQYAFDLAADSSGTAKIATEPVIKPGACLIWDAGHNITAADSVIGALMSYSGRIIVLSPFAGDETYRRGERLTPVVEWGAGIGTGLLFSPSTRRAGLVTNTDFAPSVAEYFNAHLPTAPFGHAWRTQPAPNALKTITQLEAKAYAQDRGMRILPYLAVLLALWIMTGTALYARQHMPAWWTLPPLLLLLALVLSVSVFSFALWAAALAALALMLWRRVKNLEPITGALIALILVCDLIFGSRWMAHSLLGYSATEGARYYGIGNEAMGVLISVMLVLSVGVWHNGSKWQRSAVIVALVLVAALLGSPAAGAKAGGLLVALIAFGSIVYRLTERRLDWRILAGFITVVFSVMALIAWADARHAPGQRSHIGEAAARIQQGGWTEAVHIIQRKAAIEIFLMSHSAWAILLWAGVGCIAIVGHKHSTPLYRSGLIAVAACLAFNDAGAVAAALCLIPVWCALAFNAQKSLPRSETLSSSAGHFGSHTHSVTEQRASSALNPKASAHD